MSNDLLKPLFVTLEPPNKKQKKVNYQNIFDLGHVTFQKKSLGTGNFERKRVLVNGRDPSFNLNIEPISKNMRLSFVNLSSQLEESLPPISPPY